MFDHRHKGFTLALAIAIVAVLVIAAGAVYYFGFREGEQSAPMAGSVPQAAEETGEEEAGGVNMAPARAFMAALDAQNNSGMTGTAYFSEEANGQTKVILMMAGMASSVARPAHIHAGSCPTPGAVEFPLADIVEGASETLIPVDFQRLSDRQPLAVNVHKSMAELSQYVACGDIPSASLGAMMPALPESQRGEESEEGAAMKSGSDGALGSYSAYSPEAYDRYEGQKRVLFFHASWCPFCKEADEEFNANLGKIPAGVVVLKTDYDTQTALKQKYGVTYQHTFVQVDAEGNPVAKWNGGGINELIANVK